MSIFFNAVYKLRVQLFGGRKREEEAVDVPVNRKRKLADDTSGFNKRAKLEMENIDAEEDVMIIPGESWADKTWSLVRNMFSPSRVPRKTKEVIDLTKDDEDYQIRRVRKEDLNRDSRFINQIHSSDTIQMTSPSNIQEVVDVEDNSSQGSSNDSGESSRSVSTLGNFEFSNSNFKPGPSSIVKRFHVLTKREKELRAERNKPANLTAALKSGTKTKRSTYNKIFGKHRPRASSGVNTCINMEARKNYENLLMRNTSTYLPSVLGRDRTFSSLFAPNKEQRSTFFTPSSIDLERSLMADEVDHKSTKVFTPGGDSKSSPRTLTIPSPASQSATWRSLLPSPLPFDSSIKSLVESTPLQRTRISSLEEENSTKEVYSKKFLSSLNEKYGQNKREIERKIRVEETKKEFLAAENQKQYEEDVNQRVLAYLKLTSTELEVEEEEEEEGEVELPEITPEMEDIIRSSNRARESQQLIEAYRIPISGKDIKTLSGLSWLNDEIINFYMQMIVARGGKDKFCQVYAFSTFFYSTYKDKGYSSIRRWTKKTDIFAQDIVFIPVHLGMHWCLATIDLKKKEINYYDSMGGNNQQCLDLLFKYLKEEHQDKKKSELNTEGWKQTLVKGIPQQMNGSDCGMFACKFAEYLSRRARISFTQENMPYFRRRMVYEIVKNNLMYP